MNAFSLAAEKGDGVKVRRQPYPAGVGGVKLSLETIAQMIREGALSKRVMGWAADQLHAAGLDGRTPTHTNFRKACVLLDAVRAKVVYMPDPPGVELTKSAEVTLCLTDKVCIRGGDCDCQVIALGSVLMSVGIPVRVIKQTFRPEDQEHVLIEAQSEDGSWFPLDPSTNLPCGQKLTNFLTDEFRLDPTNPSTIGLKGAPDAELVRIGKPPSACGDTCCGSTACDACAAEGKPPARGLGFTPSGPALPASVVVTGPYAQASQDLQNQVVLPIQAGDTYYGEGDYAGAIHSYQAAGIAGVQGAGAEIDLVGAANVTAPYTQGAQALNATLQEIGSVDQHSADSARNLVLSMLVNYGMAMRAGTQALATTPAGLVPTLSPQVSLAKAGLIVLGGGVAAGIAWNWWHSRRRRRH